MPFVSKTIFILVAFLIISCSSFAPTIDNETLVKLERTACKGYCPVYTVTIKKNGIVEYEGMEHVSVKGIQTATIPTTSLELIEAELLKSGFLKMKPRLDTGSWGCFIYMTDQIHIIIEGSIKNRKKAVLTYLGCDSNQVKSVVELARFIDKAVGTSKWVDAEDIP
jgi:hypothetical protein